MNLFLLTICLLNILGLVTLAYAVFTAPVGFEDQCGFRTGDRPLDPQTQREMAFALRKV